MCERSTLRIVSVIVLLAAGAVQAGVLVDDSNAYDDGGTVWQGRVEFRGFEFLDGLVWAADIEYCVYAPGSFDVSWGDGSDPSNDQHYVYAYQIFNNLDPYPDDQASILAQQDFVDTLTVGINGGDEEAANDTYIASTGDKPPHTHTINGSSVLWEFIGGTWQINYGDTSDVLLFTSPYAPEWDFATLSGQYLDTEQLPSPTPEPATLGLLIIGWLTMLKRRR